MDKSSDPVRRRQSIYRRDDQDEEAGGSLDLKKVVSGIRTHVWVILICVLLGGIGGFLAKRHLSHRYLAEAYVVFKTQEKQKIGKNFQMLPMSLGTVFQMMRLPMHYQAVRSILDLDEPLGKVMKSVWVNLPEEKSNLIKISSNRKDPQEAADIANALATVLVKRSEELRRGQLQTAHQYFRLRLNAIEERLEKADEAMAAFRMENPHFELSSGSSRLIAETVNAEEDFQSALLAYNSTLVEYENLRNEVERYPEQKARIDMESSPLKNRIDSAEWALLEAKTKYLDDNPKIKVLESSLQELKKVAEEQNSILDLASLYETNPIREQLNIELMRFQGKLHSSKQIKEDLEKVIAEKKMQMEELPAQQMQFARLRHRKASAQAEHENLVESVNAVEAMIAIGKGDLELYHKAPVPDRLATRFDKILFAFPLLGAFFGAFLGMFFSAIMEIFDSRLVTQTELEKIYRIPCLQTFPEVPNLQPDQAEDELLFYTRALFERLQQVCSSSFQTLAIASATDGEGKSTIASVLASYIGKRLDRRTLLLTFDNDKQFASYPFEPPEAYLEDWICGDAAMQEIIAKEEIDIVRGRNDSNTLELLQTDVMRQLWKKFIKTYDHIIIDVPAVINGILYARLTNLADDTLYVVGSTKVYRKDVDSSLEALSDMAVIPCGLVLLSIPSVYMAEKRMISERERKQGNKEKGVSC